MHIIQEEIGLPVFSSQKGSTGDDSHKIFSISPLPPGYGMTLGQAVSELVRLAADRPLSFLDHHLRIGGATGGAGVAGGEGKDGVPEALALAVRTTRYGCNWHGGHGSYSKPAQQLLATKFAFTG